MAHIRRPSVGNLFHGSHRPLGNSAGSPVLYASHGGFVRRTGYALSRVVITKTDSGGTSFNWSEVVGNGLEAGLSNAYYPLQERGLRQTAINRGAQIESAVLNNIAKEFWPDIRRLMFHQK